MRKTVLVAFVLASLATIGGARADLPPRTPGELRIEMRRLWDDQLVFTRNFIISTLEMSPDQIPVTEAYLGHQAAIADAFAPYYGDDASRELALLMSTHAVITVDLVRIISEGNVEAVPRQRAFWVGSAQQIADYLAALNPSWSAEQLEQSLLVYLDLTMAEIAGRSIRNRDVELGAYERLRVHTTRLADFLSNGIIKQHPQQFLSRGM